MPDVLAAIGLAQLRKVDAMRERREAIARQYTAAFEHRPEFETPSRHDDIVHAWHLYTLRLRDAASPLSRDQFVEELKSRKIGASVHFIPLHTHPYYRATYGYQPTDFPIAVQEYRREISLPIYSRMSDADVQSVVDATVTALKQPRSKSDYARA
jgi:dTDP-4-amino-4,6-dideoxygalactose transaminase